MGTRTEILEDLRKAIETYNVQMAKSAAKAAVEAGVEPSDAIENGLAKGMVTISALFDEAKIYLPQVLAASNSMEAALKVFEPLMKGTETYSKGVVVLGTVHGDVHEIGKNVIAAMLRGAGYIVKDLGRDVPLEDFIEEAKGSSATVIGASALMTTTMAGQRTIVELVKEENLDVKTLFGGAPCNEEWVRRIGGDAYCPSGAEVVQIVNDMVKESG
jgi:corrinoid protein of di/trimethylamine methyltransferase